MRIKKITALFLASLLIFSDASLVSASEISVSEYEGQDASNIDHPDEVLDTGEIPVLEVSEDTDAELSSESASEQLESENDGQNTSNADAPDEVLDIEEEPVLEVSEELNADPFSVSASEQLESENEGQNVSNMDAPDEVMDTEEMQVLEAAEDSNAETTSNDVIASGECGESATWSLNQEGVLTISGTGAMLNYSESEPAPWYTTYVEPYIDAENGIITSVVIEDGVTSIGDYAFFNGCHVTSVSVADSVVKAGDRCFAFCKSLPEIAFGSETIEIGAYAFDTCSSLRSVDIKTAQWPVFGEYLFKNCRNLETLSLAYSNITYSDYYHTWFYGCVSFSDVLLHSTYGSYWGPFKKNGNNYYRWSENTRGVNYNDCKLIKHFSGLKSTTSSSAEWVPEICANAFYDSDSLETITIHNDARIIGDSAFRDCDNLQTVNLGRRVETIGSLAFAECPKIETITIPGCVYFIGADAFRGCNGLVSVYFKGDAPSLGGEIFPAGSSLTAYYPENNPTWTDEVKSGFGGNVTWISHAPELVPFSNENYMADIETDSFVYDGTEKGLTVKWVNERSGSSYRNYPLTAGVNYQISYENNVDSGTAKVIIKGLGEYTGKIEQSFAIQPLVKTGENLVVFDGKKHTLDITAEGNATLYFSETTPLTFDNYQQAGTTTVPSRTMAGTTKVYYIAVPNNNPSVESCVAGETQLVIEKASQPLEAEISYADLVIGSTAQITASARAGAISYSSENEAVATVDADGVVTAVSEGRTKITVSAAETSNYKAAQKSIEISVSPSLELSILDCDIDVESGLPYRGKPVEPEVSIVYDGTKLAEGRDYSLKYSNNTGVGTGKVTITGTGNYIGSVTKSFEILEAGQTEKNISDCTITLSDTQLTYTGKSQMPNVTIKDGQTVLKQDVDYTVTGNQAINVGTYSLTIEGKGDYTGSEQSAFEIVRAPAVLRFESEEVEKTTDDAPFVISLDSTTDGVIAFSCDDSTVASVDPTSGEVTINGAGTTRVTAHAEAGQNYTAGEASYVLNVIESEPEHLLGIADFSYAFRNDASSFRYPSQYIFGRNIYEYIFGKTTKAMFWYDRDKDITGGIWRGNCAGFSGTSALLQDETSGISVSDFDASATTISQLNPRSLSPRQNMDITTFIESMQVAQHTQLFTHDVAKNRIYTNKHLNKRVKNLNGLYEALRNETEAGQPVVLTLYQGGGHAVLAYRVEDTSDTESKVYLYDSNWPGEERALTLRKDASGDFMQWSYEIGGSYGTWGTDNKSSSISYVPYSVIKEIWTTRGHLQENENILSINSGSVAIYTDGDKPVATVTQGDLSTTIDDIHIVDYLSLERADSDTVLLSVPVDVYTFKNLDKSVKEFEVSVANTNLGATAATTADSVTMAVDDSCNLNAVYIDAGEDDEYSITLNSSFSYDEDNVVVTGKGNGEKMEVSQTKGNINISNCQITSISINGEEINKYQITASAGEGGTITPNGESVLTKGESIEYTIKALNGYEIKDVLVDGVSVGARGSYAFKDIDANHEITATFSKKPVPISNKITANNVKKVSAAKAQSFYLKATVLGGAKLTYSSNNKSVKVNSSGKVTIAKNFVGKAKITIVSAATSKYKAAKKAVTVTVVPTGTVISKLSSSSAKQMTITWKKNSKVTGYQIQYSTSSNFANAKKKTISKNTTTKVTIKKLKQKKYYVRIRTYKTVNGTRYYSSWSKKGAVKVK